MSVLRIFFLLTVASLLGACKVHVATPRPTIPIVREVVADKENPSHNLVKGLQPSAKEGAIYILGEAREVLALSDAFLNADRFDNASGTPVPDGLPDFSGERISGILDESGAPYSAFLKKDDGTLLRELAVLNVLAALDSTCFLSPYDREGGMRKAQAKMLILSSSYMSAYGQFDVDTLFRQLGCSVPVLSPLQCMMDEIFEEAGEDFNLGVLTGRENLSAGIYSSLFSYRCHQKGLSASVCTVLAPRDSSELLSTFFDDYIASGVSGKLNYLIIDAPGLDVQALNARLEELLSVMNPESLQYRGSVAEDLKILVPDQCVLRRCYAEMRERGLFSFRIEHPRAEGFLTTPSLIPYSNRYASEATLGAVASAPEKIRSFYVQD